MISFVIVANNKWTDYATGFIRSIHNFEWDLEIILVDNGSPKPYPLSRDYRLIRIDPEPNYNYMEALNRGARATKGDWLVFCNDDVLCQGPFSYNIHKLPWRNLYGNQILHKSKEWGMEFDYIYGWMLIMHRRLWETVGTFDEHYLHAGFDDLDYSVRVQRAGFGIEKVNIPFIHLADLRGGRHRRKEVEGFRENMARSKEYFLEKFDAKDVSLHQSPR